MFFVKKNPGSSLNPWLAKHRGQIIFGRITELLAGGAMPKCFLTAEEARDFIKKWPEGNLSTMQLHRADETPNGIVFVLVPWPA